MELSISGPAFGAPRTEKRRRAGRLSRTEIELRRRHARVPCAAEAYFRSTAGVANADRFVDDSRSGPTDRARGWRAFAGDQRHGRARARSCAGAARARSAVYDG